MAIKNITDSPRDVHRGTDTGSAVAEVHRVQALGNPQRWTPLPYHPNPQVEILSCRQGFIESTDFTNLVGLRENLVADAVTPQNIGQMNEHLTTKARCGGIVSQLHHVGCDEGILSLIGVHEGQHALSVKVVIVVQTGIEGAPSKLDSCVAAATGSLGATVRIRTQTLVLNGLADLKTLAATAVVDYDDLNVAIGLAKRGRYGPTQ